MHTNKPLNPTGVTLDLTTLPKPLHFPTLFGNNNPVELEIGIGKGTFLTDQARTRPNVNFIGLEWAAWFERYAADRLRRHGCTNARTSRAEAHFFLREFVPNESLSVLHIYFPDPWPKARHHKRRLIQPPFLATAKTKLIPGGQLRVVTDHKGYWEENIQPFVSNCHMQLIDYTRPQTAKLIPLEGGGVSPLPPPRYNEPEASATDSPVQTSSSLPDQEMVGTNFERKYRREGRPFYAIAVMKSDM